MRNGFQRFYLYFVSLADDPCAQLTPDNFSEDSWVYSRRFEAAAAGPGRAIAASLKQDADEEFILDYVLKKKVIKRFETGKTQKL